MTFQDITYDRSRLETKTRPMGHSLRGNAEALDDETIADLSPIKISRMARDEMVRVIRAARLPTLTSASDVHLEYYDRKTLEILVYLARRCCRNRTTAWRSPRSVVPGGE
jgi:hypothetical protein